MATCKVISCEVFKSEIEFIMKKYHLLYDIEYTKKESHATPEKLNEEIQAIINQSTEYDVIMLGFGLCGNSLLGVYSKNNQLIIPRAHDCCTVFLGSRSRFNHLFGENKSIPWGSCGYSKIGEDYLMDDSNMGIKKDLSELIEQYGEENAQFIYDTLHPNHQNNDVMFIKIDEVHDEDFYHSFVSDMEKEGKSVYVEQGELTIIQKLLLQQWDDDFLIIEKNCMINAVYDAHEIINCKKL